MKLNKVVRDVYVAETLKAIYSHVHVTHTYEIYKGLK